MEQSRRRLAYLCGVLAALIAAPLLAAQEAASGTTSLESAQRLYYNGNYEAAAAEGLALRTADPADLAAYELRTSALLFQVKRLIGEPEDKAKALKACAACAALIEAFQADIVAGRDVARARLLKDPADAEALFFLGKLDLNYIWLHLGPLGRRTGWSEYREARKSLDQLLTSDPKHLRARVARAWIDYIVDTKVRFGLRWILGGGDKKRALAVAQESAKVDAPFFDSVEARFALWEMLAREKRFAEATAVARDLVAHFPGNKELIRFIETHTTKTP